jgi:hypothetical protein
MHSHPIRAAVFDIDGTLAMMDKGSGTYTALPGAVASMWGLAAPAGAAVFLASLAIS